MIVGQAVEAGAAAVMLPFPLGDELDLGVPVVIAEDVWEATHEAACDLYDDPSTRMFTVGVTGDSACLQSSKGQAHSHLGGGIWGGCKGEKGGCRSYK